MTYEDYSVMGIDLSSDSDVLRWDSVWKVSIQFVMLRASMGMEEDPKFDEWMREMDNGCVRVGAYHAIRAYKVTDVRKEICFFLNRIRKYDYRINFFVGIWLDTEIWEHDPKQVCANVNVAVSLIRAAGYVPIVYTDLLYKRYLDRYKFPLWLYLDKPISKLAKIDLRSAAILQESNNVIMAYKSMRCGRNYIVNQNIFAELAEKYRLIEKEKPLYTNLFNRNPLVVSKKEKKNLTESKEWAIKEGIIFPDENGSYGFEKNCTREEFLILLNRTYRLWRLYYGHC